MACVLIRDSSRIDCCAASLPYFDAVVILSRESVTQGLFPAIDLLRSRSNILDKAVIGEEHYNAVTGAVELLNNYNKLSRIAAIIGSSELTEEDRILYMRAQQLRNYMTQPFFTMETHTGRAGVLVERDEVVKDVVSIINGGYDRVAPEKFRYIGAIGESKLSVSAERTTDKIA